jgi:hypothetical protein
MYLSMPLTKSTNAGDACVERNATFSGFFVGFCAAYQRSPVPHSWT